MNRNYAKTIGITIAAVGVVFIVVGLFRYHDQTTSLGGCIFGTGSLISILATLREGFDNVTRELRKMNKRLGTPDDSNDNND